MNRRVLRQRRRFSLLVTTKIGAVYRGILYDSDAQCLVLRRAEALTPDGQVQVDGELILFLADIDTVQRV